MKTLEKIMRALAIAAAVIGAIYCIIMMAALAIMIIATVVAIIMAIVKGLKTPRIPAPHERDVIETTAFVVLPSRELTKR